VIYPSIDKLLTIVDSKYKLVYISSKRAHEINKYHYLQKKEDEYVNKKAIGRALEEVAEGLIKVKE